MSDETLQVIAEMPNVCKHIHLPVQSGSSPHPEADEPQVYREWYMDRVAAIRRIIPDCGLLRIYSPVSILKRKRTISFPSR